jgi:hypothetical protein
LTIGVLQGNFVRDRHVEALGSGWVGRERERERRVSTCCVVWRTVCKSVKMKADAREDDSLLERFAPKF